MREHVVRLLLKVATVITVLMLGACSTPVGPTQEPLTVATFQMTGDPNGPFPQALLQGVLASNQGCLVVNSSGTMTLVYLRSDAVGATTDSSIVLFGTVYHLGDTVAFGGGFMGTSAGTPQACLPVLRASGDGFWVFSH